MKTIERKIESSEIVFEAIDGSIFKDINECKKYENTVEAVLLSKIKEFQINEVSCDDLFESCSEGKYRVVVPQNSNHIDILNQLWLLNGGAEKHDLIFDEKDINTIILVGVRFSDAFIDWIWFYRFNKTINFVTNNKYKLAENN